MNIKTHEKALKENVFFTKTKWPHFNLLFKDINFISKKIKKNSTVLNLERTNLYDNISLFAPYFNKCKYISIDCTNERLKKRGSYNKKYLQNKKILKSISNYTFDYKNITLKKNIADFILIPNLMHHVENVDILLKNSTKLLKKNGEIYIFEPLLRELHQIPEDYGRFTPFVLKAKLEKLGYTNIKYKFIGGPFTSIAYFWDQAIQYFPAKKRLKYKKWYTKEFSKLLNYDELFKKNKIRKNTICPVAFSLFATKKNQKQ